MVFIATTVPIEELKSKDDILYTYDYFLLETRIQNKDLKKDDALYYKYLDIRLYPYWHNEPLHMYLISNNYYYNSNLYDILGNSCMITKAKKIPEYHSEENVKAFPILQAEERIMTEQDILKGFEKFKENNFKKNSIVEVILGDSAYDK